MFFKKGATLALLLSSISLISCGDSSTKSTRDSKKTQSSQLFLTDDLGNDPRSAYGQSACIADDGEVSLLKQDYRNEDLTTIYLNEYVKSFGEIVNPRDIHGDGYFGWSPMSYTQDRALTVKIEQIPGVDDADDDFLEVSVRSLCKDSKTDSREPILSGSSKNAGRDKKKSVFIYIDQIDFKKFQGPEGQYVLKLEKEITSNNSGLTENATYKVVIYRVVNLEVDGKNKDLLEKFDEFYVTPLQNEE